MDLADIRKKERARSAGVVPQPPDADGITTTDGGSGGLAPVTGGEADFWDEIGTERFATEEEYTQGLISLEQEAAGERVQWLGFCLGSEEYALDLEVVSELIKPRVITELPQVPDYVCGIITLRGEVLPVIDLKRRLGLRSATVDDGLQRIVVCDGEEQRVGLLVDRVTQVVRLARDEIEVPQLAGDEQLAAFVKGVGRRQGKMLIQLRPEKALGIEEVLA